ncbi:hypothetical protein NL676_003783 [Syzygium grande]|nr:hypothetical protein NL676_003783 [Syzygium grande]
MKTESGADGEGLNLTRELQCCNGFVQGVVASSLVQGLTVHDPLGHGSAGRHRYGRDFMVTALSSSRSRWL